MDQYYLSKDIPEIFKIADEVMAKKYPKPQKAKVKKVPMPDIHSNPNVEGPLYCTQEWYDKKVAKREKKYRKEKREAEEEVIQLIARRDYLNKKLGELNPGKKKHIKKIAKINIEMENIKDDIQMWKDQYDVNIDQLDKGTKLSRFVGKIKTGFKKAVKKTKKFYRRNAELINGVAAIALPTIISIVVKAITKS